MAPTRPVDTVAITNHSRKLDSVENRVGAIANAIRAAARQLRTYNVQGSLRILQRSVRAALERRGARLRQEARDKGAEGRRAL